MIIGDLERLNKLTLVLLSRQGRHPLEGFPQYTMMMGPTPFFEFLDMIAWCQFQPLEISSLYKGSHSLFIYKSCATQFGPTAISVIGSSVMTAKILG